MKANIMLDFSRLVQGVDFEWFLIGGRNMDFVYLYRFRVEYAEFDVIFDLYDKHHCFAQLFVKI